MDSLGETFFTKIAGLPVRRAYAALRQGTGNISSVIDALRGWLPPYVDAVAFATNMGLGSNMGLEHKPATTAPRTREQRALDQLEYRANRLARSTEALHANILASEAAGRVDRSFDRLRAAASRPRPYRRA